MRWADGFIAVDWGTTNRRAYLIDAAGKRADEFEDREGRSVGPDGRLPRRRRGNPAAARRHAVAARRDGRIEPRLEGSALRALPRRDRRTRRRSWSGPGEREAIVPGVSYIGDGRADVMRGEEVQLLGAVAAGLVDPDGARLPPRHAQQMGDCCATARSTSFRTVMTGELFSLLKEHSILADLLQGKVEANDAFKRGGAPRASTTRRFPPTCSRSARACCSARRRRRMLHPTPAGC